MTLKILRPSVIRQSEWYKREERDPTEWKKTVEQEILKQFLAPNGKIYDQGESVDWANQMLQSIPDSEFRGFLPDGLAVVFHEEGNWEQFPEAVHKWGMGGS